jgi:hypothetical protein
VLRHEDVFEDADRGERDRLEREEQVRETDGGACRVARDEELRVAARETLRDEGARRARIGVEPVENAVRIDERNEFVRASCRVGQFDRVRARGIHRRPPRAFGGFRGTAGFSGKSETLSQLTSTAGFF